MHAFDGAAVSALALKHCSSELDGSVGQRYPFFTIMCDPLEINA
jgi:hypothetical protein